MRSLTTSCALQRLRGVSQAGAPALSRPSRRPTRYEHSVGVAYTASRLELPIEHQVLCLLHDATHTAFSHTVDYLVRDADEATHERHLQRLVSDQQLRGLLGTECLSRVSSVVLEKPGWLRMLDALDYTIRDLDWASLLAPWEFDEVLDSVFWDGSNVLFDDSAAALTFMRLMFRAATELYLDDLDLYRHHELSAIMRLGLARGAMEWEDLLVGTDGSVLVKLGSDRFCRDRLDVLMETTLADLSPVCGETWTSKMRVLDPLVSQGSGEPVPLTQVHSSAASIVSAARLAANEGKPRLAPTREKK